MPGSRPRIWPAPNNSIARPFWCVWRAFFLSLLGFEGQRDVAGAPDSLPSRHSAAVLMRGKDSPHAASEGACRELIEQGVFIAPDATLEEAMPMFGEWGHGFIPVIAPAKGGDRDAPELMGALFHVDALGAYSRALAATAKEEHS